MLSTRPYNGYTLVEAMVSITILGFLLVCVYGVLQTGNTVIFRDGILLELNQQSRNTLYRIVREAREATDVTISGSSPTQQLALVTPDTASQTFSLSGNNVQWQVGAGAARKISSNITSLTFSETPTTLTINVTASKTVWGSTMSHSVSEKVRLRNE